MELCCGLDTDGKQRYSVSGCLNKSCVEGRKNEARSEL